MKQELLDEAHSIIEDALLHYTPSHVVAMFSGGNDSLVTTHVAMTYMQQRYPSFPSFVSHINTGIGIEETRTFVRTTCHELSWLLKEYHSPFVYEDIVRKYGFPGPAGHRYMYIKLKERAIMQLVREHKTHKRDSIALITGVRLQESARRMGHVTALRREGSRLWVSPLLNWTKDDLLDYKEAHHLPSNEVVALLHMSGECLCGAFAHKGELEDISLFYPEVGKRIKKLECTMRESPFPWGWEGKPPKKTIPPTKSGVSALCSTCEYRGVITSNY